MAFDYFANPPPGIDLSESRTASNNAIGIVLFVLSFVFVALRLLTRLRLKREVLGLDDYLMFLGLALNAGNLACCIAGRVLDYENLRHLLTSRSWEPETGVC